MDLATITMDRTKARKAFLEYRRAVRDRHSDEDAQLMRSYRELARGHQLLSLTAAIGAGGERTITVPSWGGHTRDVRVPQLAVARADARYAYTRGIESVGAVEIRSKADVHVRNRRDRFQFPSGTFEEGADSPETSWGAYRIRAMVPSIPPPLRPATKLSGYHVLWEADWHVQVPPAPADPALLKRITGDLFAVVAIWDLTEVERAVLAGNRAET